MIAVQLDDLWPARMPSDWSRSRIRNVAALSPNYSAARPAPDEPCTVVPMDLLSDDGTIDVSDQQLLDVVSTGLPLFEKGDVLFAKITPCMENGKGAFVRHLPTRYAFGSTEFHVLRPGNKVDGQFLYYATFNPVYRAYAAENMLGAAGQKRVSSRFLKDTRLFLPSLPEQRRIAAYLDASCASIDAAVAAKRRQLATLDALRKTTVHNAITRGLNRNIKFKAAGLQWLTEVPAHWMASRIKNVAKLSPGYSGGRPTNEELCTFVPMESLSNTGTVEARSLQLFEDVSSGLTLFETGDVLFAKITPCMENGKGAFIANLPTRYAFGSTEFHVLRPGTAIDGEFLYYFTYNPIFRTYAAENMSGAAGQKRVSSRFLMESRLFLPPRKEQMEIVSFIKSKEREFRALFSQIGRQTEMLLSYRKSLIHECVTGQRRITEADVRTIQDPQAKPVKDQTPAPPAA